MGSITISNTRIKFSRETTISHIVVYNKVICFSTWPIESDIDYSKPGAHQIWIERCINNPSELYCYDINGNFIWKFESKNVVGFGKIVPELKEVEDFISVAHYQRYIDKYKGKELLEVYAGEFRYVLDANTGEIYDKMETR